MRESMIVKLETSSAPNYVFLAIIVHLIGVLSGFRILDTWKIYYFVTCRHYQLVIQYFSWWHLKFWRFNKYSSSSDHVVKHKCNCPELQKFDTDMSKKTSEPLFCSLKLLLRLSYEKKKNNVKICHINIYFFMKDTAVPASKPPK